MGGAPPPGVSGDRSKWLEQDYGGGEGSSPLVSGNVGGAYQQESWPGPAPTDLGYIPAEGQDASTTQHYPVQGPLDPPAGTNVVVEKRPDGLEIHIPPVGFGLGTFFLICFTILWNFLIWSGEFRMSRPRRRVISLLIMIPFMAAGVWLIWLCVSRLAMNTRVYIGYTNYFVEYMIGSKIFKTRGGRTRNITAVRVNNVVSRHVDERQHVTETTSTECEICENRKVYKFGGHLRYSENDWIAKVISHFLQTAKDGPPQAPSVADPPAQAPPFGREFSQAPNKAPIPDHWMDSGSI